MMSSLVAKLGVLPTRASQLQLSAQSAGSEVVRRRLSCFAARRDLPGSGIEPTSPASAGGLFTTEPPGKPTK